MIIQKPENENYAATVVQIRVVNELENCDNVVGVPLFGYQAIVGKETKSGDKGIVFPPECRLSEEYAAENCLYRHAARNKNPEKKGYLEDNRRVKAMKFRGQRSDALFMPLESLSWTGANIGELKEGDTFDTLGGKEICRKYVVKTNRPNTPQKAQIKKFERVDKRMFPEHIDTDNWWRNEHLIPDDYQVVVTQKVHGTSVRIARTIVKRQLNWREKVAKKLGISVQETAYDNVYGSRKVIKDANAKDQQHFYESDLWSLYGHQLDGLLPDGFMVFGELVGWTPEGSPIQKNYTYRIPQGTAELYVYRVAQVNPQGRATDLTWDQVKEFCQTLGLKHVPELWRGPKSEFDPDMYMDKRFFDEGLTNCLQLDDNLKLVDEGVCIRADYLTPIILKAKSAEFLQMESALLDQDVIDIETQESDIEP